MSPDQASEKERPSRILVIEDSPTQAVELRAILSSEPWHVELVADAERGLALFEASEFDVVITDVMLPGVSGYEMCDRIKQHPSKADVPVILLTSLSDPMDIIRGLECGANNFITKPFDAAYLLGRVKTMLAEREFRKAGKVKVGVEVVFLGRRLTINSDKEQILDLLVSTFEDTVRTNQELQASKLELAAAKRQVDEYARQLENQVVSTERKRSQAEQALVESERRYRRLVEFSPDAMFINREGKVAFANNPCLKLFGAAGPDQVLGKSVFDFIHPDCHAIARERMARLQKGEPVPLVEEKIVRLDGKVVDVELSAAPFLEEGINAIQVVCRDISDRKRLEERYLQAQKMEAVGQLAGGVAHDFNNLLTVISGYSEILITRLPADDPMTAHIQEIHKAGERAAHLTRQLLAFSRKAVIEPRVLDLNIIVTDTEKMLRRLIGEDICLHTVLAPALRHIKADAGQIEQIIINLALNARDAMPQGGKLTIETGNVVLDGDYAKLYPEVTPGRYVVLAISDTGCGMTPETRAHLFEPFFTTKEPGKGTGLGLATVYGIVKQNGGHIGVYSEIERGTTFKIYLPPADEKRAAGSSAHGVSPAPRGTETILLVEDEDNVRAIAKLALQNHGYTVLEARNGAEAVRRCEQYAEPIHLLVTDVVMPEMGGRQVAERLVARRQGIKVLYLSGYTDDAVVRHGILQAEVAFLQKPFTPAALASKVREVLDQ